MAKKKKSKEWKIIKQDSFDIWNRDAPCLFINNTIFIGNKGTTHATMVQELLYGMNFDSDYYSMYKEVWEEEKYIQYADERNTTIWFYRGNIEDHENYVFGHKLGNNIYWDMERVPMNIFNELLSARNKNNKYKHFSYGDYYGGNIIKELKNYSHKTNLFVDK